MVPKCLIHVHTIVFFIEWKYFRSSNVVTAGAPVAVVARVWCQKLLHCAGVAKKKRKCLIISFYILEKGPIHCTAFESTNPSSLWMQSKVLSVFLLTFCSEIISDSQKSWKNSTKTFHILLTQITHFTFYYSLSFHMYMKFENTCKHNTLLSLNTSVCIFLGMRPITSITAMQLL